MKRSTVAVFLLCMIVYMANGRPHQEVDCVAAPYVAWSLVKHGNYDLREYPDLERFAGGTIRDRPDGVRISMRPPGSALAAVPFIAPLALSREKPLRDNDMHHMGKLAASVAVAVAAVFFFLICHRLTPDAAWPATILFALGSCLCSVASQAIWMHGPAVLGLTCALYFLTRPDCERPSCCFAIGISLGFAVLSRPTAAFFVMATMATLLGQRRWRSVVWVALGGVIPAVVLFHYNLVNFGHPVLGGYENDNWSESPPLWLGIGGLLIAPSRGLLVYSPALLLVPCGVWMLARQRDEPLKSNRGILASWLVAAGATLLFFARWYDWRGGWCYGPRFLCESMPILCLIFAVAYVGLQHQWQRGAAISLVVLSVLVHLVGIFGYSGYDEWQYRHMLPDQGRCLFEIHDTQIEAHARAVSQKYLGVGKK